MSGKPVFVLEKPGKRQGYLSMLIAFAARRDRPGIAQHVAPKLDKLFDSVKCILSWQTINRRHDSPSIALSTTVESAVGPILPFRISDLLVNIDHIEGIIAGAL